MCVSPTECGRESVGEIESNILPLPHTVWETRSLSAGETHTVGERVCRERESVGERESVTLERVCGRERVCCRDMCVERV